MEINTRLSREVKVCDIILQMDSPFKISELFAQVKSKGIDDKVLVVDILDQLYESGLINPTFEDDIFRYQVARKL